MILLKDKIQTLTLILIMSLMSFTYVLCMSVVLLFLFNEFKHGKDLHITVVNYTQPEVIVKEVAIEPKPEVIVKEEIITPEPEVLKVEEPKPKVVEVKKPKVEAANNEDEYLLAQIINAEAKGEPYNGKVAVGNVVMNRVKHPEFPDTIEGVIFQKGQFYPVTNGTIHNKPSEESIKAASEALNGKQVVGSKSIYFYNPKTSTSDWIFTRKTIMDIGNHRFAY